MTTSAVFPKPKDPQDKAWYTIWFSEPLDIIDSIVISPSAPDDTIGLGSWTTPGDALTPSALVGNFEKITPDGTGVTLQLTGGTPGATYAIRANVTAISGSQYSRSGILAVTGL